MKTILVFGAGKSATVLIDYLKITVAAKQWKLIVADANLQQLQEKLSNAPNTEAAEVNVTNAEERSMLIEAADLVISLLPPFLHSYVAKDCVAIGRHLLNASYVDESIQQLEAEINSKELLFLCEMGLDPGIDHMSAMQLFDEIQSNGGTITSFKSHCGGLVAPESDDNPWHYKISWNPRNIVMAGHAGAAYKQNGEIIKKDYAQVFEDCPEISVDDLPAFAWYPNRDSLSYIPLYKLENAATFIRTTLRYADFCKGWDVMVDLDLTSEDDTALVKQCSTYADWFAAKTKRIEGRELSLRMYLELYVKEADHDLILEQFAFLELESNEALPSTVKCSADILQQKAEQKLALKPTDKDMIVMLHEIEYSKNNQTHTVNSSLVVKGDDSLRTAMAKTVGLPLGIAAKLILEEKIKLRGLHIPTRKEIYEPVLLELQQHGVVFNEQRN
ncbi:saccharopine dehydrogenase [Lacibacter luteus]|uniref:Saccharopine dehydrogenase n=1 Tax=Lacibacter luteus TaxID=2508719 RepID=A0A4Q1CLB7_9BACT|nr:saccharopine dehydrogenase C-terminal domain-containing protein [Lacibacter luteus]RXK61818.1 saccharopine dehydrogenase [Lacibacter luteus]